MADERILFSTNAAAMYLLPPTTADESVINEWLEWESTVLRPVVAGCIAKIEGQSKILENCLQKLDQQVSQTVIAVSNKHI